MCPVVGLLDHVVVLFSIVWRPPMHFWSESTFNRSSMLSVFIFLKMFSGWMVRMGVSTWSDMCVIFQMLGEWEKECLPTKADNMEVEQGLGKAGHWESLYMSVSHYDRKNEVEDSLWCVLADSFFSLLWQVQWTQFFFFKSSRINMNFTFPCVHLIISISNSLSDSHNYYLSEPKEEVNFKVFSSSKFCSFFIYNGLTVYAHHSEC